MIAEWWIIFTSHRQGSDLNRSEEVWHSNLSQSQWLSQWGAGDGAGYGGKVLFVPVPHLQSYKNLYNRHRHFSLTLISVIALERHTLWHLQTWKMHLKLLSRRRELWGGLGALHLVLLLTNFVWCLVMDIQWAYKILFTEACWSWS